MKLRRGLVWQAAEKGIIEVNLKLLFFSYAHEDQVEVEKIAESLQQDGFLIWLDKKNLLPGDDWRVAIETAVDKADSWYFFLSQVS